MLTAHLPALRAMNSRALEWKQVPAVSVSATTSVELARRQDPAAPWEDVVEKLLVSGQNGAYAVRRGALVADDGV